MYLLCDFQFCAWGNFCVTEEELTASLIIHELPSRVKVNTDEKWHVIFYISGNFYLKSDVCIITIQNSAKQ